jgi:hypothetical protein
VQTFSAPENILALRGARILLATEPLSTIFAIASHFTQRGSSLTETRPNRNRNERGFGKRSISFGLVRYFWIRSTGFGLLRQGNQSPAKSNAGLQLHASE